jgi:DNA-binding winged helix-turn-helix (wHTH) protein
MPRIGKTSLLRHLPFFGAEVVAKKSWDIKEKFVFAYVNASPYGTPDYPLEHKASLEYRALLERLSAYFWRDIYQALLMAIREDPSSGVDTGNVTANPMDIVYELKSEVENLIQNEHRTIVLCIDDFEGIASLPVFNSSYLRGFAQNPSTNQIAYVVTSRRPLDALYSHETWGEASPFWNIFAVTHLGLLDEDEARALVLQTKNPSVNAGSILTKKDVEPILRIAGRHPEFIQIACEQLYDMRTAGPSQRRGKAEYEELQERVYEKAEPLCNILWQSLEGSEQQALRAYSSNQRHSAVVKSLLVKLARRGLLERDGNQWRIFSEVMHRFILQQQEQEDMTLSPISQRETIVSSSEVQEPFTGLEEQVYNYLRAHAGEVCSKEEIKRAVWQNNAPKDSGLQKLIERIRTKIEPGDPRKPQRLIAVRRRGYMLRKDPSHII